MLQAGGPSTRQTRRARFSVLDSLGDSYLGWTASSYRISSFQNSRIGIGHMFSVRPVFPAW